jgi:transposase
MAGSADGGGVGKLPISHPHVLGSLLQGRHEKRRRPFDRELYKKCNRIERLAGRFKQFRRVVTHYEMTAESYPAMLTPAAILLLWL